MTLDLAASDKTWKESPQKVFTDLKKAIEGYYHDLRSQEVPSLVWENLYPTSDSKNVPPKASTTILLVGSYASKMATDLAPFLGRRGYIIRPIEDEGSLTEWDERLLQTIERDVWSRKITSLIGLYIQDQGKPLLQRLIYQKWQTHLERILSKSSILRSYACRGDLNQDLLTFDVDRYEISRVSRLASRPQADSLLGFLYRHTWCRLGLF